MFFLLLVVVVNARCNLPENPSIPPENLKITLQFINASQQPYDYDLINNPPFLPYFTNPWGGDAKKPVFDPSNLNGYGTFDLSFVPRLLSSFSFLASNYQRVLQTMISTWRSKIHAELSQSQVELDNWRRFYARWLNETDPSRRSNTTLLMNMAAFYSMQRIAEIRGAYALPLQLTQEYYGVQIRGELPCSTFPPLLMKMSDLLNITVTRKLQYARVNYEPGVEMCDAIGDQIALFEARLRDAIKYCHDVADTVNGRLNTFGTATPTLQLLAGYFAVSRAGEASYTIQTWTQLQKDFPSLSPIIVQFRTKLIENQMTTMETATNNALDTLCYVMENTQ